MTNCVRSETKRPLYKLQEEEERKTLFITSKTLKFKDLVDLQTARVMFRHENIVNLEEFPGSTVWNNCSEEIKPGLKPLKLTGTIKATYSEDMQRKREGSSTFLSFLMLNSSFTDEQMKRVCSHHHKAAG